jgi:hypothetical protein
MSRNQREREKMMYWKSRVPVESEALVDEKVECANDFVDGHVRVRSVSKDDVDVVEPEALERGLCALDNVLAAQSICIGILDS